VNTRAITTAPEISACDICGRNLLRGERVETYLNGAERHTVCELCTARAVHGGWLREGELPDYGDGGARVDRRRSLLSRLRSRREASPPRHAAEPESEPFYGDGYEEAGPPAPPPARNGSPARPAPVAPPPAPVRAEAPRAADRSRQREPRHVRAVPTSNEHKILSAVEVFNGSEHPRTVAGISRSLGLPEVAVLPSPTQLSVVNIVVAWELCWYRYEMDLSDEVPGVRVATQGYELDELAAEERRPNAVADEGGNLSVA
jgi:hypothetical protein